MPPTPRKTNYLERLINSLAICSMLGKCADLGDVTPVNQLYTVARVTPSLTATCEIGISRLMQMSTRRWTGALSAAILTRLRNCVSYPRTCSRIVVCSPVTQYIRDIFRSRRGFRFSLASTLYGLCNTHGLLNSLRLLERHRQRHVASLSA